jgi:FMN phosphatase YigB (HAD superfamily)
MDATRATDAIRWTLRSGAPLAAGCLGAAPSFPSAPVLPARRLAVEGLIFDTDDVLYDATPWPRRLWRLVTALGLPASYASFFEAWQRQYLADVCRGRREYAEAFQSFLLQAGLTWAQIDEVEAASRAERADLELSMRPLPGVVKTIARLHASGLPLVAWADSPQPAARVADRIERLGLAGKFRDVLSSFDLEAAQPAARCYLAALGALGKAPADVLYVGHDALHLAGAAAVGLRTAAFNYQAGTQADFYLVGFDELAVLAEAP